MQPYYADERVTLYHGKSENLLPTLAASSVDAVVTDPPYELGFMGRAWDATGIAYSVDLWREVLRVLRPGGHLLAFGGTRTVHRMTCAIEDAGFEIRDGIDWLYGSGFPKSLDVSKAIDKAAGAERTVIGKGINYDAKVNHGGTWTGDVYAQDPYTGVGGPLVTAPATDDAQRWSGWGTALKPAREPIVVARRPLAGTVAANVLAHGTGALNIDACRVGTDIMRESRMTQSAGGVLNANGRDVEHGNWRQKSNDNPAEHVGRWPTNIVLSHAGDDETGDLCADRCVPGCPVAELDAQSGAVGARAPVRGTEPSGAVEPGAITNPRRRVPGAFHADEGGASRFFPVFRYQAKAPASERPKVDGEAHATVKPLALMRWLVRLVAPTGGIVLEPFAGSGTTAEACLLEGFGCIAVEREAKYLPLIMARISKSIEPTLFGM
jgi:site-specific DNA-methyltransferase (adenine-specific)